jgi:copper chaperone
MTTVNIKGMSCGHCVAAVTQALERLDAINKVSVDLEKGEARFAGEPALADVRAAIEAAGFEVVDENA